MHASLGGFTLCTLPVVEKISYFINIILINITIVIGNSSTRGNVVCFLGCDTLDHQIRELCQ